ncbi:hypothetical protein WR25_21335, partial [Diploscapter pachys]
LATEFTQFGRSDDVILKDKPDVLRRIFWITNNVFSTNAQKMQEVKALMIPLIRKQLGDQVEGVDEDVIWASQEQMFTQLFNLNYRWNIGLLRDEIHKEVRSLEHTIRQMRVDPSKYGNTNEGAVRKLKVVLAKVSDSSLDQYIELRDEIYKGKKKSKAPKKLEVKEKPHDKINSEGVPKQLIYRDKLIEFVTEKEYNRTVNEMTPSQVELYDKIIPIALSENKNEEQKTEMLKPVYFAFRRKLSEVDLSDEEIEATWKVMSVKLLEMIKNLNGELRRFRKDGISPDVKKLSTAFVMTAFSREFFEGSKEDALKSMKKAALPFSDETLMIWEVTERNLPYTEHDAPYGKRILIFRDNARLYHDTESKWTNRYAHSVADMRRTYCDTSKSVEQRLNDVKPQLIASNEIWIKNKMSNPEAEKFWEDQKEATKKAIEQCVKTASDFKAADPKIFWISNNIISTDEQKLTDIKTLLLPIIRKNMGAAAGRATDDQLWAPQEEVYKKFIDKNQKMSVRLLKNDVSKEVRYLEHEIRQLRASPEKYGHSKEGALKKLKMAMNKYSDAVVTQYIQLRREIYFNEKAPEKQDDTGKKILQDDSSNDRDISALITSAFTSQNDQRPMPINNEKQAILYLFPEKNHQGTAKVINFYRENICYVLTECINFLPWSAITYLPTNWCICFSDSVDCTSYNACWKNFAHTGKGTIMNFFKGDVCYNLKTCNITSPASAYVYAPKCWSVCFSKNEDCTGYTACWPNHGWPIDLYSEELDDLKSFAIHDKGCYEFNKLDINKRRTNYVAETC